MKALFLALMALSTLTLTQQARADIFTGGNALSDMVVQTTPPQAKIVRAIDFGIGIVLNDDLNCGAFENGVLALPFETNKYPFGPAAIKLTNRAATSVLVRINHSVFENSTGNSQFFAPVVQGNVRIATAEQLHGALSYGVIDLQAGQTVYVTLPTVAALPLFTEVTLSCKLRSRWSRARNSLTELGSSSVLGISRQTKARGAQIRTAIISMSGREIRNFFPISQDKICEVLQSARPRTRTIVSIETK